MADQDPKKNEEPAKADPVKTEPVKAEAVKAEPVKAGTRPFQVKAIATGYFGGRIRVYGDLFDIAGDVDFASWMEPINEADRKRLAATVEKMHRARKPSAAPGTRPTPATKLI